MITNLPVTDLAAISAYYFVQYWTKPRTQFDFIIQPITTIHNNQYETVH
jgi:hypothetical protein